MSTVETVQGHDRRLRDLGVTLIHEHVRFRDEAVAENWPGRYDEKPSSMPRSRRSAPQRHGVQTIVDPTAMFGGRDVRFMKRVPNEPA